MSSILLFSSFSFYLLGLIFPILLLQIRLMEMNSVSFRKYAHFSYSAITLVSFHGIQYEAHRLSVRSLPLPLTSRYLCYFYILHSYLFLSLWIQLTVSKCFTNCMFTFCKLEQRTTQTENVKERDSRRGREGDMENGNGMEWWNL